MPSIRGRTTVTTPKFDTYVYYINGITPYAINDYMTEKGGLNCKAPYSPPTHPTPFSTPFEVITC
jgi:hypothetical protein